MQIFLTFSIREYQLIDFEIKGLFLIFALLLISNIRSLFQVLHTKEHFENLRKFEYWTQLLLSHFNEYIIYQFIYNLIR